MYGTSSTYRTTLLSVLAAVLLATLSFSACSLDGLSDEGTLSIVISGNARNLWEPDAQDLAIVSCRVQLSGAYGTVSRVINIGTDSRLIIEGLRSGPYLVTVEGFNEADAGGDRVAELIEREPGERTVAVSVRRGEVSQVTTELVPSFSDTGALEISAVRFTGGEGAGFSNELISGSPRLILTLSHLGGSDLNVLEGGDYVYAAAEESATAFQRSAGGTDAVFTLEGQSGIEGPSDIGGGVTPALLITDLPSGWYRITAELQTCVQLQDGSDAVRSWKGIYTAQVMNIRDTAGQLVPTRAEIAVSSLTLQTGSLMISIAEAMKQPFPLELTAPDTIISGQEALFSAFAGYPSYRWYVDGELQTGTSGDSFSWTFTEAGFSTVSVAVLTDGIWVGDAVDIYAEQPQP
jgi:hypothetical protein